MTEQIPGPATVAAARAICLRHAHDRSETGHMAHDGDLPCRLCIGDARAALRAAIPLLAEASADALIRSGRFSVVERQ